MNARDKITKARAGLILDLPFFGSLALKLEVVEDATCETAWTDGSRMGYNPAFIESLSLAETKGLICHEVMHNACAHQVRRGDRDRRKWNLAGDYAINQVIEDCKIALPAGRPIDPAYKGMCAEEIYSKLPSPPAGEGQGKGEGQGDKMSPASMGAGGRKSPLKKGDQGGCSDPGKCGEVRDAVGAQGNTPSPADLTQSAEDWKIAVAQAAQEARMQGKLPAGLDRIVGEILAPRVDWRDVLRRFVDQTAKNDYTWSPPNRRYVYQGLYLPSVRSEELLLVVAVDTSGSIGAGELNQFASELTAILEDYKTSCTVIYCDSAVAHVEEFSSQDLPLRLHPKGGGGTDFRPPFAYVGAQGIAPSCLIYLTDLECSSYPAEPAYPVLWAHIGKGGTKPPFGEEVKIS